MLLEVRAGDILLTADDSRRSRFIRWWTSSEWSHAALVLGSLADRPLGFTALEVSPPAARIVDDRFYSDRRRLLLRPPISAEQGHRAAHGALEMVGSSYDWIALAGFAFVPGLRGIFRRSGGLVCSGVVAYYHEHAGLPWANDAGDPLDPRDVSPDAICDRHHREGWPSRVLAPAD